MSGQDETETPETSANARVKELLFPSRPAPSRVTTQAAHVLKRKFNGDTAAMAAAYNVTPRAVRRWIDGTRKPVKHADRLYRDAVEVQTTKRSRDRRARQMERRQEQGLPSGVGAIVNRATAFEIRGSDAVRARDISISFSSSDVAKLARATDEEEINQVVAEGIARYMNGGMYAGFSPDDFSFNLDDVIFKGV
ncbi:hypothetical protein OG440_40135 (plasmid) [Streptomyces sp. NBC_00637]|uniref:hypothetical protein n=1 Tax=Streptomyces sp. NBC_00637 TaxID=2903667 RepID=UPI002F9173EC